MEMENKEATDDTGHAGHSMGNMQHGAMPAMGMAGHDRHGIMIADLKKRFYVVLGLTVPIMLLSNMIQQFMGVHWQFAGAQYVLFGLSTIVLAGRF